MGDRYEGSIKCPHCTKKTQYLFNDEWATIQHCDKCKKSFEMELKLVVKE